MGVNSRNKVNHARTVLIIDNDVTAADLQDNIRLSVGPNGVERSKEKTQGQECREEYAQWQRQRREPIEQSSADAFHWLGLYRASVDQLEQILNFPNCLRQISGHCGRDTPRAMNFAKVVVHEIKARSRPQNSRSFRIGAVRNQITSFGVTIPHSGQRSSVARRS